MRTNQPLKYVLFVSCFLFWVASGLMIAVGVYARLAKDPGSVNSPITDPSIILMTVGIFMFAVTFFGCLGALRDMHILLKIFACTMLVILGLQVLVAVLGFVFSSKVLEKTASVMVRAISRYREDLDLQNFIDYVQKKFECCGVASYMDWSENVYFACIDSNPSLERCAVPFSCCIRPRVQIVINTMCGYETQNLRPWYAGDRIHVDGCLEKMVAWGKGHLLVVAGVALGLVFLEISVIVLAMLLIRQINVITANSKNVPCPRRQMEDG
ncbi:tetraspanin-33-like isoform X2 [Ambystoma mexicanum]|uniref:tetraspanin-33-like isoform X2 n=1 Tax=Ambystoma mexicanum TaxID=8296 RepID=UPI0037E814F1